jgi:hypothetical protein
VLFLPNFSAQTTSRPSYFDLKASPSSEYGLCQITFCLSPQQPTHLHSEIERARDTLPAFKFAHGSAMGYMHRVIHKSWSALLRASTPSTQHQVVWLYVKSNIVCMAQLGLLTRIAAKSLSLAHSLPK